MESGSWLDRVVGAGVALTAVSEKCDKRAILIVTQSVQGTASNVAKQRVELCRTEPAGHEGPHYDRTHDERWQDDGRELTTVLRHESDE